MKTNAPVPQKDQKEKPNFLVEVFNAEKQLWTLFQSKGLLHSDAQNLYGKICCSYEKIFLNDHELAELQEVEFSLWKLHYKHIDEFRKRIKRNSANAENSAVAVLQRQRSNDNHVEGFKSFLSEATEFYQQLIKKIKKSYGLPEEFSFHKRNATPTSVELKKMQKCQFLCHRFNICIGDLARYREQYGKPDAQDHNWSVAATHYLEATMIWPDSGNPQNQLAVLATYVGDDFLALYHCVRSLAVKEPFPDAWNNLILLFERNRSSHLPSLLNNAHFNFLKPSERISIDTKLKSNGDCSAEMTLWSLFIRTISFFFIESSLEDFRFTFASMMRELDQLMALDDSELKSMLESYLLMDSARVGPFRALQIVSIFIFVIQKLVNTPETKGSTDEKTMQQFMLTQLSLTATFVFMGRLVDRCAKANPLDCCPLLPSVLVFVEWLLSMLGEAERYGVDDESRSAMTYFFTNFVKLLRQLNVRGETLSSERPAMWEDYELRGFAPLAHAHVSLDFSAHQGHIDSFASGTEDRAQRIVNAALKIANRSKDSRKWIVYDKLGSTFCVADSNGIPDFKESDKLEAPKADFEVKESHRHIPETREECEKQTLGDNARKPSEQGKSISMEEEEVIVFKPLTRYNSAPLYSTVTTKDALSPQYTEDQAVPFDDCLRRATSMLIAQNKAQGDTSVSHPDFTNFSFKQQESLVKDTLGHPYSETPISAGPPSLNAWVLDRGIFSNDREQRKNGMNKHSLSPIDEIASATLTGLSMNGTQNSVVSSGHSATYSPYSAPVPSAPLLPDDAPWFGGVQPNFPGYKGSGEATDSFCGTSQVSGYSDWTATHRPPNYVPSAPGFTNGYPPFRGLSSSEWLRQYRENLNLERTSHTWPAYYYATGDPRNFHGYDASRFDLYDQRQAPLASNPLIHAESPGLHSGYPLVYGVDEHRRETFFHNYQRPSPYGCGAVTDLRDEPQPLLQYLKEKEWLLQRDPTVRGPTYMGS